MTQREIALATKIDEGYTSRVVGRLEEENLVVRNQTGAIRPRDPGLLLDAWREEYDFEKHPILRGHVPARSGDALLCATAETLSESRVNHTASGLGAAWLVTRFAGLRLVTFYLSEQPPRPFWKDSPSAKRKEAPTYASSCRTTKVYSNGASDREGVRCVHPIQVYLDLGAHPERAPEAATELRKRYVGWRRSA